MKRMKRKRFLSTLLSVMMVFSLFTGTVSAAELPAEEPEAVAEELPEAVAEELPEAVVEELPEESGQSTEETAQEASEDLEEEALEPAGFTEESEENTVPSEVREQESQPEAVQNQEAESKIEEEDSLIQAVPEEEPVTAAAEPEETEEETPEEIPEETPEEISEEIPEEISEETPEEVSETVEATVSFTAQAANAFLCAPQTDVKISSDLAESYGYKDEVSQAENVSALDVLVKAHELVFGEAYTKENAASMLAVGNSGYITTIFGEETGNCGFAINGKMPHSDILPDGSDYYIGYTVNQAVVSDADMLEFWIYQDDYALDNYVTFYDGEEAVYDLTAAAGAEKELTLKGYAIGWYGCNTQETVDSKIEALEGVQLGVVDEETGAVTPLEGAVSDENGNVSLKLDEAGEYVLTAQMPEESIEDGDIPVILPVVKVKVAESEAASHQYLKNVRILSLKTNGVALSGFEFDPDVFEYNIVIPDSWNSPVWELTPGDTIPENVYVRVLMDGKSIVLGQQEPALNTSAVSMMTNLSLFRKNFVLGASKDFEVVVGVKDESGEYTDLDVYRFHTTRRAVLSKFSVTMEDGTALNLTPEFINAINSADQYEYMTAAAADTEKLLANIGVNSLSSDLVDVFIGDEKAEAAESGAYELNLSKFNADESGNVQVPIELRYKGEEGLGAGTKYQLNVQLKDVLPIIKTQPADLTCGKEEIVQLFVEAEATGDGELSYQWYEGTNGTANTLIPEATEASYQPPTSYAGVRNYRCEVTNTVDGIPYMISSRVAAVTTELTFISPPSISNSCDGEEYKAGEQPAFTTKVEYEKIPDWIVTEVNWYRNTEDSTEGGVFLGKAQFTSGGGNNSLSFGNYAYSASSEEEGTYYYYCEVVMELTENGEAKNTAYCSDTLKIVFLSYDSMIDLAGGGTDESPWQLTSSEDLEKLRGWVEDGYSFSGKYFCLAADIELPADWKPIGKIKGQDASYSAEESDLSGGVNAQNISGKGTNILPFAGTFDGKGYTVTVAEGGLPLFGLVRDAVIKDLNIYGKKIAGYGLIHNYIVDYGTDGDYNTGCPDAVLIDNVTLKKGSSTLHSGFIGGYASGVNKVTILNSTIEKDVVIGYDPQALHSAIGSFAGSFNGVVQNCVSYATVNGAKNVGGIIGKKGQSMGSCEVHNSAFIGTINCSGSRAGGIFGAGYGEVNGSAPNTPVVSVMNCYVDAVINGADEVGGILGSEPNCEDCWNNGKGSIENNVFYGTIHASGEKAGAIVGFFRSFNENQGVNNNYYLDTCGVDRAIGQIDILTVENPESGCKAVTAGQMADGTVVSLLNASESSYKNWMQGEKYPVLSKAPLAYELTVSGDYKNVYVLGEKLDLSGAVFTALWNDGTTTNPSLSELQVEGYDANTRGEQTVTIKYGAAKAEIKVTVLKPAGSDLTVKFTLLGDSGHGSNASAGVHTLADGNLDVWVPEKEYIVDSNATVKDLLDRVLAENNMTCDNPSGNYVKSITRNGETLGEFTNGVYSGWMYTLNDVHVNLGVSEQYMENGDVIVFHYTDDYRRESSIVPIDPEAPVDPAVPTTPTAPTAPAVPEKPSRPVVGSIHQVSKVQYKIMSAGKAAVAKLTDKTVKNITIPATVEIGGEKFTVTTIGSKAFKGCTKLQTITLGKNITMIGSEAFSGCTSLTKVKSATAITSINKKAFYNCKKLTMIGSKSGTITLSKVKTIGNSAFYGCKAIKKVNLSSSALTKIDANAFYKCTSLTTFTASSKKLTTIGKQAFYGDKKLASVTLKTEKLAKSKVGTNAFKGIKSTCKFKVPSKKVTSYQSLLKARGAGNKIKVTK